MLRNYLQEDGTGPYSRYRVPDLVPPRGVKAELLMLLESPHLDELRNGIPLSGSAGRAASRFLFPACRTSTALGEFIKGRHARNDFRVAIVNVSPVPLQEKAFERSVSSPNLSGNDWAILSAIQQSNKRAVTDLPGSIEQDTNRLLLPGLRSRLAEIELTNSATLFLAGTFAERTWKDLGASSHSAHRSIPHPSWNGWEKATKSTYKTPAAERRRQVHARNLQELRVIFSASIS